MNPTGQLYSQNNGFSKRWATDVLSLIEFKQQGYTDILDIGCGTGEVTNVLLNQINNVEKIIAFDKNESMIELARSENSNPKIEYLVADVTKPESFRPEWRQKFDLITSFLVIHWTPNQYSNLETMKSLLAPNGEVILLMSTTSSIGFTPEWIYEPGWEEYTEWRYPDEVTGYRRMAESLGFTVKQCTNNSIDYVYPDLQSVKDAYRTYLPQAKRIPEAKISEIIDDAMDVFLTKFPLDENGKSHMIGDAFVMHLQNNS
ncbi:malonyl-[acyl-carrier protein] O-methyltransferase-like isoform X2 [Tubulanus polymorphus]|uniref:malonyl-[acyl-carrier protein] O-methyltransferase-like isoform X2 n=1 Tax=Tubulanus polymorphus TaxID=672921 RepID=UPI003DA3AE38